MKKKLFILICLIALVPSSTIYAFSRDTISLSENSASMDEKEPVSWISFPGLDGKKQYRYRYKKMITTSNLFQINAYDMNGKSIIPNDISEIDNFELHSGTWVGLSIIEERTAGWIVTGFEFEEIRKKYTCTYAGKKTGSIRKSKNPSSKSECTTKYGGYYEYESGVGGTCYYNVSIYDSGDTIVQYKDYFENYSCPDKYEGRTNVPNKNTIEDDYVKNINEGINIESKKKEAYEQARGEARTAAQRTLGDIKFITNNDSLEKIKLNDKNDIQIKQILYTESPIGSTGTIKVKKSYEPKNVCMNVKTGTAKYSQTTCETDEIEVKNGTTYDEFLKTNVTYWRYFSPLNAKSNYQFFIRIGKNQTDGTNGIDQTKLTADECHYVMKKYNNYKMYISPLIGNENWYGINNGKIENSIDWARVTKDSGCYFTTTLYFPIKQKFYGEIEENDTVKLHGFNFFYRPIDITNPFPNGLTTSSIWSDYKQDDIKYGNVTYTTSINAKTIREYNKDINNNYTSWGKMNLDGTSIFIEQMGIINRASTTEKTFYKLGCGPLNSTWKECGG